MENTRQDVCPVERAGHLDSKLRRWLQNPQKLVGPYITSGMTVLDVGCGPGFFSCEMARMVGDSGRVIAADLQDGMLEKVREKIQGTELEGRIELHHCDRSRIGWDGAADFVLAFYMLHELPDQQSFFQEISTLLKPGGRMLIVEPPLHVSKDAFDTTLQNARNAGLSPLATPRVWLSKTALLAKG